MYVVNILITSMGFRVETPRREFENEILSWAEENLHAPKMGKNRGRIFTERGDPYYAHMPTIRSFYFHRTYLSQIKILIQRVITDHNLSAIIKEHIIAYDKEPYRCTFDNFAFDLTVTDEGSKFFYQNEVSDKASDLKRYQTIFAIQTGRGKSISLMKTMVKRKQRTGLIIRPTYVDKWLFDLCTDPRALRCDRDEVLVCKGVQSIYDAYDKAVNGKLDEDGIKVIVFPTTTLWLFLSEYMTSAASNPIDLEHFFDVLGIGIVGYDEVHEHFHLVYMSAVMLNPPALIDMSATLRPGIKKAFIADRYMERFPVDNRVSIPIIPVVNVVGLYYHLDDSRIAFWANKMTPYNHMLFESKLIKEGMHISYLEMVWDLIEKTFLKGYIPGQKTLILFSTIAMCEYATAFIRDKLDKSEQFNPLTVAKYNGGDSYDDFIEADFSVSTPGKAGTAIDKKGLVHMYITTSVEDQQLNEQMAGRPREVKLSQGWDIDPTVWLFHAINIPKHGGYLSSRQKSLTPVVKSFKIVMSPYVVRKSNDHSTASRRASSTVHRHDFSKFSRKHSPRLSRRRKRR